eukprot:PhM_4_TR17455/c0_g1_i2/m.18841
MASQQASANTAPTHPPTLSIRTHHPLVSSIRSQGSSDSSGGNINNKAKSQAGAKPRVVNNNNNNKKKAFNVIYNKSNNDTKTAGPAWYTRLTVLTTSAPIFVVALIGVITLIVHIGRSEDGITHYRSHMLEAIQSSEQPFTQFLTLRAQYLSELRLKNALATFIMSLSFNTTMAAVMNFTSPIKSSTLDEEKVSFFRIHVSGVVTVVDKNVPAELSSPSPDGENYTPKLWTFLRDECIHQREVYTNTLVSHPTLWMQQLEWLQYGPLAPVLVRPITRTTSASQTIDQYYLVASPLMENGSAVYIAMMAQGLSRALAPGHQILSNLVESEFHDLSTEVRVVSMTMFVVFVAVSVTVAAVATVFTERHVARPISLARAVASNLTLLLTPLSSLDDSSIEENHNHNRPSNSMMLVDENNCSRIPDVCALQRGIARSARELREISCFVPMSVRVMLGRSAGLQSLTEGDGVSVGLDSEIDGDGDDEDEVGATGSLMSMSNLSSASLAAGNASLVADVHSTASELTTINMTGVDSNPNLSMTIGTSAN